MWETFYKRQPGSLDWCDRRSGSFGNVHGHTRAWLPDLDEFLCASVSLKNHTDLGREDKDFWKCRRCGRCGWVEGGSVVSRGVIMETQIRTVSPDMAGRLGSLLWACPLWVMPLTSQYPAGHSIMLICAQWTPEEGRKGGGSGVEGGEMKQSLMIIPTTHSFFT